MDEYLIIASGNHAERKWWRRTLVVAKHIADRAIKDLGYARAIVVPINNPNGTPLYVSSFAET